MYGDEKECITTLFMYNAAGVMAPPMVLFWYKRLHKHLTANMPGDWGYGSSEKGWMTAETFYSYIANIFYPWLLKNNIQFPVVLYVDGHASHINVALSNFCREHDIELIKLLENSTHITQPLDAGLFRPLKMLWKNTVIAWKIDNRKLMIKKEDFPVVLKLALDKGESSLSKSVKNAFKSCGIYPLDPDAVNYDILNKKSSKKKRSNNVESPEENNLPFSFPAVVETKQFLDCFEKKLPSDTLEEFRNAIGSKVWTGDVKNEGLFNYWLDLKKSCGIYYYFSYMIKLFFLNFKILTYKA